MMKCKSNPNHSLSKNRITSKGANLLFDMIQVTNSSITGVYMLDNQIDDECMESLGICIQRNNKIKNIHLGNNMITDQGIDRLSEYLFGNLTLTTLAFENNKGITDLSLPTLVDIAKGTYIAFLSLRGTLISESKQSEINNILKQPFATRGIPIKSKTKSATKSSLTSFTKAPMKSL